LKVNRMQHVPSPSGPLDALVRDLVAFVAREPRTYRETLEAWRTSCPRLTVWEDAIERGLVERRTIPGEGEMVAATAAGLRFLAERPQASLN
jgi:hypothetical protein